ncbi:MAG: hypothetical protein JWN17_2386 [Frankiales bacterium]|nr:hypothetical protein [Frankiales bacterium]
MNSTLLCTPAPAGVDTVLLPAAVAAPAALVIAVDVLGTQETSVLCQPQTAAGTDADATAAWAHTYAAGLGSAVLGSFAKAAPAARPSVMNALAPPPRGTPV